MDTMREYLTWRVETFGAFEIGLLVVALSVVVYGTGGALVEVWRGVRMALREQPVGSPVLRAAAALPAPVRAERPDTGFRPRVAGIVQIEHHRRGLTPEREPRPFVRVPRRPSGPEAA